MADPEKRQEQSETRLHRQYGELMWTARAKATLGSIFLQGRYPAPIQALLEFIDNSVGHRNRDKDYPTAISLVVQRDRINVTDFGGQGADADGIRFFARLGDTKEQGIGYRGAGAKSAAFHLAMDLDLSTKKAGDDIDYFTRIDNFGDENVEYRGTFPIDASPSKWDKEKGRFEVNLRRLKVPATLMQGGAIRRVFSEVYRPLLVRTDDEQDDSAANLGRVVVDPEGNILRVSDQVVISVTGLRKIRERVEPLHIPLLPGYSEDDIQVIETNQGEKIYLWYGEMDQGNDEVKSVKPGLRFYYDGRLLNIDFCGFDGRDPRLQGLVGEVHIDNIQGIKDQLSVNKSAGINTESSQWKRVIESVNIVLSPFVEQLKNKPIAKAENIPAFLNRVINQIHKITDLCLREIAQEGALLSVEDLAILVRDVEGANYAARFANTFGSQKKDKDEINPEGNKTSHPKKPVPDIDPSEALRRIKRSFFNRHDVKPLQNPRTVSLIEEQRVGDRKERVLVINSNNPFVKLTLLEGELATGRLLVEELAVHIASEWCTSLEDFRVFREDLRFRIGNMLLATPEYQRLEKASS